MTTFHFFKNAVLVADPNFFASSLDDLHKVLFSLLLHVEVIFSLTEKVRNKLSTHTEIPGWPEDTIINELRHTISFEVNKETFGLHS
jgi:hypothetical protein